MLVSDAVYLTGIVLCLVTTSRGILLPEKASSPLQGNTRTFTIGDKCFLKDGQPFRYISGSFHYWRQPPEYWEDTFLKMRAAGLNAIQTYVDWNLHEPEPEEYNFKGNVDIQKFIQLAQKSGLLVILRPGPFIDAEVDFGGLPYWLLRMNSTMKLRSSDPSYLQFVERWYRKMLPMLKDLTYANGGPIISAQVENEYGSRDNDMKYKVFLRDLLKELLGPDVVLFTTDGNAAELVERGMVEGTLTTTDFGTSSASEVKAAFEVQRQFNKNGPLVNSEFYPGWLDHWGEPFNTVDADSVVKTLDEMLQINASVNTYMFYGGTNYGFVSGANEGDTFEPCITSYDYDAPLSEAGDITPKYTKIRNLLQKYGTVPPGPVPPSREKAAYGKIQMHPMGSFYHNLQKLSPNGPINSTYPLSFEVLKQAYGFVLYRTIIKHSTKDPSVLAVNGLHDRAYVFVNKEPVGILSRFSTDKAAMNVYIRANQTLDILVQNEGRFSVGPIEQMKGIVGNVTLDGKVVQNWQTYPLTLPGFPIDDPKPLDFEQGRGPKKPEDFDIPWFFTSKDFDVDEARDTYLRLDKWSHGYAFINGRNLGRYWPSQGPQMTLYVPGVYLYEDRENVLELFELEPPAYSRQYRYVTFEKDPTVNGTIPDNR